MIHICTILIKTSCIFLDTTLSSICEEEHEQKAKNAEMVLPSSALQDKNEPSSSTTNESEMPTKESVRKSVSFMVDLGGNVVNTGMIGLFFRSVYTVLV